MTGDSKSILKKLPSAIQTLFGFALVVVGVNVMLNTGTWIAIYASNPQMVIQYLFFLIGILYLLHGIPSLIEGVMTMNAERGRQTLLEIPRK